MQDTAAIPGPETSGTPAVSEKPRGFDWEALRNSPGFWPGVITFGALLLAFWGLLAPLPKRWATDDYYSHGFLVPFISGFIVYKWWPRISQVPVRPFWPALAGLLAMLAIYRVAYITDISQIMSIAFLGALFFAAWFVAGFRWMMWLTVPIMYLAFMLPIWTAAIDSYTNPLQLMSTEVAYWMLEVLGLNPIRDSQSTTIYLNRFVLDVGVPCSGFKLVLAVTAFTIFFMCVARLNVWANLIMVGMIIPVCLFMNGLRIALIGIVGDSYGKDAGMQFHDYSGYIMLVVCFVVIFKIARLLGWKD